jgi:hypothetical protein
MAARDGHELGETTRPVQSDDLGIQAEIGVAPLAGAAGTAGDGRLDYHVLSWAYVPHRLPRKDDRSGHLVAGYQRVGQVACFQICHMQI